jgi:hypothetical protein
MDNDLLKEIETIKVHGRSHAIIPFPSRKTLPNANYQGTGKAFIGILKEGETLEGFKKRYSKSVKRNTGHPLHSKL